MAVIASIIWYGRSGEPYKYRVYDIAEPIGRAPGNFLLAKQIHHSDWKVLYVGQTADLSKHLARDPGVACAISRGASHVHISKNERGEEMRRREVADLIARWKPPCNVPRRDAERVQAR